MKIFVVILILVVLSGGGYWYFLVYQQRGYVQKATPIFEHLQSELNAADAVSVKSTTDYQGAMNTLSARKQILEKIQEELSLLKKPFLGRGRKIHANFIRLVGDNLRAVDEAEKLSLFFLKMNEFYLVFYEEPVGAPTDQVYVEPPPPTAGDLQKKWRERTARAKAIAADLFKEEPSPLHTSDGYLKYSFIADGWEKARGSLDALVAFYDGLDPAWRPKHVDRQSRLEASPDWPLISFWDSQFIHWIGGSIRDNSARDILDYRYSTAVSAEELASRQRELGEGINNLRQKYGK